MMVNSALPANPTSSTRSSKNSPTCALITMIIAAILHDVIEDTETAKDHVGAEFGEDVAELVDGKQADAGFSPAEAHAEYFPK